LVDNPSGNKRHLLFQVLILILIVAIPMHFYINSELENSRYKEEGALLQYAQKVANKIYRFSNEGGSEFYFPRSNIFRSALYGADGATIFSLLEHRSEVFIEKSGEINGVLYLKYPLKENVFYGAYLIVSKPLTYSHLITNVLVILMVITLLVLLATFSIIRQSAEPYKRLNRYLENFIKDAMHEMKTPIGVILLNLDGLESRYPKDTMITRARSALKNMIVVYEDLEFFVRNKRSHHPRQEIDLTHFCRDRIAFFGDLLQAKAIMVNEEIEEGIFLEFSSIELSRILDNTLSNAIKYSKNNTCITVTLKREERGTRLSIADQGRGIEDTGRIFERYYRGDKISGGFGIGLNIVKNICDKHGIVIHVLSKKGEGTQFDFLFLGESPLI